MVYCGSNFTCRCDVARYSDYFNIIELFSFGCCMFVHNLNAENIMSFANIFKRGEKLLAWYDTFQMAHRKFKIYHILYS